MDRLFVRYLLLACVVFLIWTNLEGQAVTPNQAFDKKIMFEGFSFALPTDTFKKPPKMDERLILLINSNLYPRLKQKVDDYIQALFDEGIDVRPYVINERSYLDQAGNWLPDAGSKLHELIRSLYAKEAMSQISSPDRRGLLLLGRFPAAFILWQQEHRDNKTFANVTLRAVSDFKNIKVQLSWTGPSLSNNYTLRVFKWNSEDQTEDLVDWFNIDVGDVTSLGNNQYTYFYDLYPLYSRQYIHSQREFKFQLNFIDNNNNNIELTSNVVNWNFIINPCDYVLADIDGFMTSLPADKILTYKVNDDVNNQNHIKAVPYLVVTTGTLGIEKNEKLYETYFTDVKAGDRLYAGAEMYFGRIDPSSLVGLTEERKIALVQDFLVRNVLWRKTPLYRKSFSKIYFFRSTDFVNPINEKEIITNEVWRMKSPPLDIKMEDAKKDAAVNCQGFFYLSSSTIRFKGKDFIVQEPNSNWRPIVRFIDQNNNKGDWVSDMRDINNALQGNQLQCLDINFQATDGAVVFFPNPQFGGNPFLLTFDDNVFNRARNQTISVNAADLQRNLQFIPESFRSLTCLYQPPNYDTREHLLSALAGKRWLLVDLGVHGIDVNSGLGFRLSRDYSTPAAFNQRTDVRPADIDALNANIKFLVNHCCFNGEFTAWNNMGTEFLFMNQMLAEWAWAGAGTEDHYVLHEGLAAGKRFGQAVMDNFRAVQQKTNAVPWRSYFTVTLGDPTLRVFYNLPDLCLEKIHVVQNLSPTGSLFSNKPLIEVSLANKGEKDIGEHDTVAFSWELNSVNGLGVYRHGSQSFEGLKVKETKKLTVHFDGNLPPGAYEFKILADPEDRIVETNENNNESSTQFVIKKTIEKGEFTKFRLGIKGGGLYLKADDPLYIAGEPNTETTHLEYPYWDEFFNDSCPSYQGGIYFESFFNPNLFLEVGISYSKKFSMTRYSARPGYFDRMALETFAVPVLLKINLGRDRFQFFLGGGLEPSYTLSLKNHYHFESGPDAYDEVITEHNGKKLAELLDSPFSFSLLGSIGFRFDKITLEVRYLSAIKEMLLKFEDSPAGTVHFGKFKGLAGFLGISF